MEIIHKSLDINRLPVTGVDSVVQHAGRESTLEHVLGVVRTGSPHIKAAQEAIRASSDPNQRRKLKSDRLPAFAMGRYVADYVKAANCLQTSGLIIDIDHLPPEKFEGVFAQVRDIPEVYAAFRSPSGDGIKAILLFSQPLEVFEKGSINVLPEYFRHLYRFYAKKLFQIEEVDSKTCNIDRLCYFAYDPHIYVNPDPKLLSLEDDREAIDSSIPQPTSSPRGLSLRTPAIPTVQEFSAPTPLSESLRERIASALPYLKDLQEPDWFRVGLALKPYGQFGWEAFLSLSLAGEKYGDSETEIRVKFDALPEPTTTSRVTLGTLFYLAKNQGWPEPSVNYLTSAPIDFWSIKVKQEKEEFKEEIIFPELKVLRFLENQGFRLYGIQEDGKYGIARLQDNVIHPTNVTQVFAFLKNHIEATAANDQKEHVLEAFLKKQTFKYTMTYMALPHLYPKFLKDTRDAAYFFFANSWVEVTKLGVKSFPYEALPGHVHQSMLTERSFEFTETQSDFQIFLEKITAMESVEESAKRLDSLKTSIGYLIHGHPGRLPKAIVLMDEKFTSDLDDANGGTGKSIIGNSFKYLRPLVMIDGKNWNKASDHKLQAVKPETKIVHFNDLKQEFALDDIFTMITETAYVNPKNRDAYEVAGVKVILSTNYSLRGNGAAYERRQHIVELNQAYNKTHTPMDDFQKRFFDEWEAEDWNAFFTFYLGCVQQYLTQGLQEPLMVNTEKRKAQLEVGEFFYNQCDPSYIATLIHRSVGGLSVKSVLERFKSDFPDDTKNLTLRNFTKKINILMRHYGVNYQDTRRWINGIKETLYVYTVTANTSSEVLQELKELRSQGGQSPFLGGLPERDFFSDRGQA